MTSWVGRNQSELIARWGPPQSTISDGNGGTILIYQSHANPGPPVGQLVPNLHGGYEYVAPQNGYNQARMYYVDSKGINLQLALARTVRSDVWPQARENLFPKAVSAYEMRQVIADPKVHLARSFLSSIA
jgi:hypothetical protein